MLVKALIELISAYSMVIPAFYSIVGVLDAGIR